MSRSDAFEKLKISRELQRRPVIREAFEAGLAYSKVRALMRLKGRDDERDAEYAALAVDDTVHIVGNRVTNWNYFYAPDDNKPASLDDHYGIRRSKGFGGGLGKVVIEAPDDMLDRLLAVLDAYGDYLFHNQPGTPEPPSGKTGEESTKWTDNDEAKRSTAAKRLDYLFDLLEEVTLTEPDKIDPYNAVVGVAVRYEDLVNKSGPGLTNQQTVLTPETIHRLMCDAGITRIVIRGESEIIDLGREERLFNRKQRRAIRYNHGHVCAIRGCGRRITHIHHVTWWEHGGETNIADGIPLCSYHHHLVHEGGWTVAWNPTLGLTRLEGPKGQVLETQTRFARMVA